MSTVFHTSLTQTVNYSNSGCLTTNSSAAICCRSSPVTCADSDNYFKRSITVSTHMHSHSPCLPLSLSSSSFDDWQIIWLSISPSGVCKPGRCLDEIQVPQGNSEGTGFLVVRAQSPHSGDVNKILGPGLDMLWGISVCKNRNTQMETPPEVDLTLAHWCHLNQNRCRGSVCLSRCRRTLEGS